MIYTIKAGPKLNCSDEAGPAWFFDLNGTFDADGTCKLLISPSVNERCYMGAFHAAKGAGSDCLPDVLCPVTVAVGDDPQGMVKFLAVEGRKQAGRFPKGRCER